MGEGQPGDVVIVGGGIIGLTVAWRLSRAGAGVTVIERDAVGEATSHVAAGMLAPSAEAEFGAAGRRLLELGLQAAQMWPAFARELTEASGLELELRRTGTLLLARDEDEAGGLERALAFRRSLGLTVERLRPSQARELESALAPTLRLALHLPDDHSVDPRQVLRALRVACQREGVRVREQAPVSALETDGGVVQGVRLEDGEHVSSDTVVLAMGPWSERIEGLLGTDQMPVRPVKGQILRLRDPAGPGMLERVVRYEGGYLVPRGDGRYVLGATVEERGFELTATAGGVYGLLREARELVPGITELEIEELSVGLRPSTPDNLPVIGRGALGGLMWASGHHRNGILLAPLTGALIVGLLGDGELDGPLLETCAPGRFARASSGVLTGGPVGAGR